MEKQTIELDCPPGSPRPDDLLPGVLNETGLVPEDFEITSKCFGNWEFTLNEGKEEAYLAVKEVVAERIKSLYSKGLVRYASW